MDLTIGPNQFFWKAEEWLQFYRDIADTPVRQVVLGELVCSKRLPFYQDRIIEAIDLLQEAGKEVVLTSLALVTLPRERKATAALAEAGLVVEINDLTALAYLPEGAAFQVGPLINCYNIGTLDWLARQGARSVCLPPELPLAAIDVLAKAAAQRGVTIEVWGHGRLPLAISGRCYHARRHGRSKDNCHFACEEDPDGLAVETLDGQPFLAMNGVQTLSDSCASVALQVETLRDAGVSALRLSPQSGDFAALCHAWQTRLAGQITGGDLVQALRGLSGLRLSDGFLTGARGADWSGGAL